MKIENIKIKDLTPYEKNSRKHVDYDVDIIAKSIDKYGFNDPIGVWGEKNIIVEGHGRYLACKKLGIKEVPCIRLDNLTEDQRREYTIMHNKSAELSSWDFDLLNTELADLDMNEFEIDWGIIKEEDINIDTELKINPNKEIDLNDYTDNNFELECPKCHFRFNPKGNK